MACSRIPQPVTGMIIGDNMFLTPIEVRQMRQVPELVFINCCHLGKMSDASGLDESRLNQRQDYNLMAASVAVEFIRMGVRAVVATGWAVDDRAASTFARIFYDHMLRGTRFGEAVKAARKETYESHPGINTWGAYQCYGDPDYRLTRDNSSYSDDTENPAFASVPAVITEIENLSAQLETMGARKPTWHLGRLKKIEDWLKEVKWTNNGSVNLALARAYWEALEYVDAQRYFQRALSEDPASVTLKDIEQLANLTSRACVDVWKKKEEGTVADLTGQLIQAKKFLDWLKSDHLPNTGDGQSLGAKRTVAERESLVGSTHKRCAWIAEDRKAMIGAVKEMDAHYAKAWDVLKGEPKGAYALLNTVMAGMVKLWLLKSNIKKLDGLIKDVATARALLAQDLKMEPEFWDEIMPVDCDLFEYLLSEKTPRSIPTKLKQNKVEGKKQAVPLSAQGGTDKPDVIKRLAVRYQEIRKLGSRRQFASVLDQIEFLETMANRGGKKQVAEDLHRLLATMAKEL
jgi:CHAT domain-containing protein